MEWEDLTQSELQQGSETVSLIRSKDRPEALTRQRIIFVMTGISPKGSTDRFTHVRRVRCDIRLKVMGERRFVNGHSDLTESPVTIHAGSPSSHAFSILRITLPSSDLGI